MHLLANAFLMSHRVCELGGCNLVAPLTDRISPLPPQAPGKRIIQEKGIGLSDHRRPYQPLLQLLLRAWVAFHARRLRAVRRELAPQPAGPYIPLAR